MSEIKIFLASSKELKSDRDQFEIFINRRNKALRDQGIFLHLVIWEDFLDTISVDGLQGEYNNAIKDCDIQVALRLVSRVDQGFKVSLRNEKGHRLFRLTHK